MPDNEIEAVRLQWTIGDDTRALPEQLLRAIQGAWNTLPSTAQHEIPCGTVLSGVIPSGEFKDVVPTSDLDKLEERLANPEQGVLDDIDQLMAQQLSELDEADWDGVNQPKCSLCERDWHGLRSGDCPGDAGTEAMRGGSADLVTFDEAYTFTSQPGNLTIIAVPAESDDSPENQYDGTPMTFEQAVERSRSDLVLYGTAYLYRTDDGRYVVLNPGRVVVQQRDSEPYHDLGHV